MNSHPAFRRYRKCDCPHPELSLLRFDVRNVLERVKSEFSALSAKRVEVWIHCQPALACIAHEDGHACITLHSVLNHPQTSERVIAFILQHELLHLLIPPREVDGQWKSHPPEFWDAERVRIPMISDSCSNPYRTRFRGCRTVAGAKRRSESVIGRCPT